MDPIIRKELSYVPSLCILKVTSRPTLGFESMEAIEMEVTASFIIPGYEKVL
jgi:hypothetical protein